MFVRGLLACCVLCGFTAAASPEVESWDALLKAGLQDDDAGEHRNAAAKLQRACEIASAEVEPSAQTRACTNLAWVQALSGRLADAEGTLLDLIERLEEAGAEEPHALADALVWLAEVQTARAKTGEADESIRRAASLLETMAPGRRASILLRLAQIYLPLGHAEMASELLHKADEELAAAGKPDDPGYVRRLSVLAELYFQAGRRDRGDPLVAWLMEEGSRRFGVHLAAGEELGRAYVKALSRASALLAAMKLGARSGRLERLAAQWQARLHDVPESYFVGEQGVAAPRLRSKVDPQYTKGARSAGLEGTTVLLVEIWPDGKAHCVQVLKALPYGLSWAAIGAVRKWKFQPGTYDGVPVKVAATVEVNFRLWRR